MKRKSFRYIFVFNTLFIAIVCVCVFVCKIYHDNGNDKARHDIASPVVSAFSVSSTFCETAKAAVLVDAKSGALLFEKNAHTPLPMASTTKIMTALAVIENSDLGDVVIVSERAANTEGSSIYLVKGERIKVQDLLYGLLLESGNDAATALAEGVFGSEENCVSYMNKRAHEMGLVLTNFENPHGLDSDNHYTTAYELAIITRNAMKNPVFRRIVSTRNYTTKGENARYFSNHNRLLSSYSDTIGVKTGYTSTSGRCLVTAAKRENEEYIAVTLNDKLDWQDHKSMHEFAFENFEGYEIASKDTFVVRLGFEDYVPKEDVYITTSGKSDFSLEYRIVKSEDGVKAEFGTKNASLGFFHLEKKTT